MTPDDQTKFFAGALRHGGIDQLATAFWTVVTDSDSQKGDHEHYVKDAFKRATVALAEPECIKAQDTRRHPTLGGCWFCHSGTGEMLFSTEFDTFVHQRCIEKQIHDNPEAVIMARELNLYWLVDKEQRMAETRPGISLPLAKHELVALEDLLTNQAPAAHWVSTVRQKLLRLINDLHERVQSDNSPWSVDLETGVITSAVGGWPSGEPGEIGVLIGFNCATDKASEAYQRQLTNARVIVAAPAAVEACRKLVGVQPVQTDETSMPWLHMARHFAKLALSIVEPPKEDEP